MEHFFKRRILSFKKIVISTLLVVSPLAFAGQPARIYYTEAKLKKAEERIREYRIRGVTPPTLDIHSLQVEENSLGRGATSIVYGAKLGSKEVVIKFYRKDPMKFMITDQMGSPDYYLKQNYFMLETISDLGLAPKPYALLDEAKTKALLEAAHFPNDDQFVGAMVIERKRTQFLQKGFAKNTRIPYEPRFQKSIEKALQDLSRIGASIGDIDYLIDQNGKFSFLDLDFWNLKTKRGVAGMGKLQETDLFGNYDNRRYIKSILLNVMEPPKDPQLRLKYAKEIFSDRYPSAYNTNEVINTFALDSDESVRRLTREFLRRSPDHWRGSTQANFLSQIFSDPDFLPSEKSQSLKEFLNFMMETEVKHDDQSLYYAISNYATHPAVQTPELTSKLEKLYLKVPVEFRANYLKTYALAGTRDETKQILAGFFSIDPSPEIRKSFAELRGESLPKTPFIPGPACIRLHEIVP